MKRHELKIKRLQKEYYKCISKAFFTKLDNLPLDVRKIIFNRVEIDKELTRAKVFFFSYEEIDKDKAIRVLKYHRNIFFEMLKKRIRTRYLPKLEFVYDDKEIKVNHVLNLIEKNKKKYD